MYEYFAEVLRIIDGDTIKARVDLGMNVKTEVSVRFMGIDAMPMNTAAGQIATVYLNSILPIGSRVLLQSHGLDKYGRWLGTLSTTPTPQLDSVATNTTAEYGRNINAEMVAKKHARPMEQ